MERMNKKIRELHLLVDTWGPRVQIYGDKWFSNSLTTLF